MRSIRARLSISLTACFSALLAAGGYGVFYAARTGVFERIDDKLRVDAYSIMSATYLKDGEEVELHFTVSLLREFSGDVRTSFYEIRDQTGESVKRSESLRRKGLPRMPEDSPGETFWNVELDDGRRCRAMAIRYGPKERGREREPNRDDESLNLVVAKDIEGELASLAALRNSFIGVSAMIIVLVPATVLVVLKRGMRPLMDLASGMGNIDSASLARRLPDRQLPGELKPIALQLNLLLDRLRVCFQRERTFSADVAHELRTPIAELRNMAEVGLKWKDAELSADYRSALEIAVQMERIVNQLFDLMRCESDQFQVAKEAVSLRQTVDRLWNPLAPQAEAKNVLLRISIFEDVEVRTDPDLLSRVLSNLLENAAAYVGPAGRISIAYDAASGVLRIANTTRDLEAEDVNYVFDRFWRKDKARTDENHSGIGLSIARAFAERLGLALTARFEAPNEIAFLLSGLAPLAEHPPLVPVGTS